MPFDAPAKPSMFPEAEAYFRQLVPISAADYERMATEERGKAFTVAGAMQLDAVQYLHDEIGNAIQSGEGFDAWSKRVSKRLRSDFADIKSHKLETIFRTNVQDAYGVGRWYQQQDPEVTDVRPWMLFDTVDDARRSPICTDMADPPMVKRHDDPFVAAHWPPLHHRCRSQWQSISNRRARQLGGETAAEPTETPAEGFGLAPPLRSEWRPDQTRYSPDLWKIHEQKVAELKATLGVRPTITPVGPATPKEWADSLSTEEYQAVQEWTSNAFKHYRALHAGKSLPSYLSDLEPEYRANLALMESAFARSPQYQGTAYRGMRRLPEPVYEQLKKPGAIIEDDAFTSYSSSEAIAVRNFAAGSERSVVIEVDASRLVRTGAYELTPHMTGAEAEVVLDRPRLRVVSAEEVDGVLRIKAEEAR